MNRATLLSSSAQATTAAEARFRLDYPLAPARAARVIALDPGAEVIVRRTAELPWDTAQFFVSQISRTSDDFEATLVEVDLRRLDGSTTPLSAELVGVDAVVMIATMDSGAEAAATIGAACTVRSIMTAGIVHGDDDTLLTVSALRPYARVLMVSNDENDLSALLTAIRA
jgi:hypothetical protein